MTAEGAREVEHAFTGTLRHRVEARGGRPGGGLAAAEVGEHPGQTSLPLPLTRHPPMMPD